MSETATPLNLRAVEHALDTHKIWVRMNNGRYWRVRRNGQTKIWIKSPKRFSIPIKAGLRAYGYLNQLSEIGLGNPQDKPEFLVTDHDPNN